MWPIPVFEVKPDKVKYALSGSVGQTPIPVA
jgi:hypothetical protein